jgi:tetratricopeptide (TPR) repeat protein
MMRAIRFRKSPMTPFCHRHPIAAYLISASVALLCGLAAPDAPAQVLKEPALDALYSAERFTELDQIALARLAQRADDAQAVLATALVALSGDDSARRAAAISRAEACVQRAPNAAGCHYALGTVLGVQAMSQGLMKMAGSVGQVKESLLKALELEPGWYPARSAVVEFYLQAPGLIGGSSTKALEVARAAPKPEQARALEARIQLQDDRFDDTLRLLADLKPGSDSALNEDIDAWRIAAAFGLLRKGQPDKARPVFERVQKDRPDSAFAPYGLARMQADAGAHTEAVKLLEQCARLRGAAQLPLDYRLGLSQQALGQNDAARASFKRYVAAGKGESKSIDDAKKRLGQLGA